MPSVRKKVLPSHAKISFKPDAWVIDAIKVDMKA